MRAARRVAALSACLWLAALGPRPAAAQSPAQPGSTGAAAPATPAPDAKATADGKLQDGQPSEAPDSPRASARAFLDLTGRKAKYEDAARYLVVPRDLAGRGPELARRMRAVIDHSIIVDLDAVSPLPGGAPDDGLPDHVDRLGMLSNVEGGRTPVYVVRRRDASGAYWAFSSETVRQIDAWYDALPDRWVREWMPESLQRRGPLALLWWQWLALPFLAVLAHVIARLLAGLASRLLARVFARTRTEWDDRLLVRVEPAARLFVAVVTARALLPFLALLASPERVVHVLLAATAIVAIFWAVWLSVDVWLQFLLGRPWAADNPSARSLLSVAVNFVKLFVAITGILAVLAVVGYPVATVLAGLGIGGIALAFGAQKTIENLFGSVSLAVDQPFRVGDFVKVEDFTGNVERIGMRSTQIRTLDRTTITMPNGRLSELRIEGFGMRDRIRFATTLGTRVRHHRGADPAGRARNRAVAPRRPRGVARRRRRAVRRTSGHRRSRSK